MRICVLGAGSLGCVVGGRLALAGHRVTLINRNVAVVAAVAADGLILEEGGRPEVVPVAAAVSPAGLPPQDLVVVLVKSAETSAAIGGAAHLVGPETVVMSLQNGLGHEDILSGAVGADRVIAGKTYAGGVMLAPGVVRAGTAGKTTVIGEPGGGDSRRAREIAQVFSDAGLATEAVADIRGAIWDKLLINVATGALSGITRLDYGNLYDIPELAVAAQAAVAEAMAVAERLGVTLSIETPEQAWRMAAEGLPFAFKASMLQSLEKGRPTEVDFINGAVVREGRRLGVPVPVNETLVACIKGVERALAPKREDET